MKINKIKRERFKSEGEEVIFWVKKQIEKSFKKEMGFVETNIWLTHDGQPDVMVECFDKNDNKKIFRFSIITTQCLS